MPASKNARRPHLIGTVPTSDHGSTARNAEFFGPMLQAVSLRGPQLSH